MHKNYSMLIVSAQAFDFYWIQYELSTIQLSGSFPTVTNRLIDFRFTFGYNLLNGSSGGNASGHTFNNEYSYNKIWEV